MPPPGPEVYSGGSGAPSLEEALGQLEQEAPDEKTAEVEEMPAEEDAGEEDLLDDLGGGEDEGDFDFGKVEEKV